ncbi:MAG: serine/threonine protein kinase [Deltaproteobacteria bacterium]|nr:serine/threonine protein kinase [Deltaproteobacteria bacterium]
MGEVYKVVHLERGTVHALKYLPLANSKIRKRLLREADLQTQLAHQNVVTLTEVLDIEGDPGLVMEYVDGPPLSLWLRERRLTLEEAEALFIGVVSGVAHAHRRGLVHRDLKPSNILLARTPDGMIPKVADFGIAKALSGDHEKLTQSGHSLGSPAYMAPEQIQNAHEVDQRADMFSLGCLLFELVCGVRAFQGEDTLEVLNAVAQGNYVHPTQVVPDLPGRIVDSIVRCLAQDPKQRVQTCEELLEILDTGSDDPMTPVSPRRSEEATHPRIKTWSVEKTVPARGAQAGWERVASVVFTLGVLVAALLLGIFGAWIILG